MGEAGHNGCGGQTYNVYCDESRHTSDASDRYMVIGAIACSRHRKRELVGEIHRLRRRHGAQGEFGWKRLSPNKREFYLGLLDLFLATPDLRFRCIVVDRTTFVSEDPELGFYKLYYQMLVHWLQPGCDYYLYLDWQQNREQNRFRDLRDILRRKLSGRAKILALEPSKSRELELLQLTDLLIGAVGYDWNGRSGSEMKAEFCRKLARAFGRGNLKFSTPPPEEKFNVFRFGALPRQEAR